MMVLLSSGLAFTDTLPECGSAGPYEQEKQQDR